MFEIYGAAMAYLQVGVTENSSFALYSTQTKAYEDVGSLLRDNWIKVRGPGHNKDKKKCYELIPDGQTCLKVKAG